MADHLGSGDPVDIRHVDVHQYDIRIQFLGQLDTFLTGPRSPHDLNICFELKQFSDVFPCLHDVVHD